MIDVTKLHRDLCGQAVVMDMLGQRLPHQAPNYEEAKRAYLHSARMLLAASGVGAEEAYERTADVYADVLEIHKETWVK